ncbi:septum formation initiator family protein [Patescibacteria group bacterium]|nr:septum formation initiator family protein [Patescibacteria group bacterium]MBU1472861.1 septum formation initiator family protein [Patescibacteria group bacterium]MBU2459518.1 septum formation initiator family protein [Patescibacteria group bacterium]MBU2543967.1 septum formation initiator family protein [Patescibacteria group bacterium]
MGTRKVRLFRLIAIIVSFILVVNVSRSMYSLWAKQDMVRERKDVLTQLQKENEELHRKLDDVQSQEFVEKEARNKLGLVKEGETIIIMPNDPSAGSGQANLQMTNGEKQKEERVPNWQKWWGLFF